MIPELPAYAFAPNWGGLASLVLTVLLPIAVGVIARPSLPAAAKAMLLLGLAVVKTFVEAYISAQAAGVEFHPIPVLMNVSINFGVACAFHFGLWKPTGVSETAALVGPQDRRPYSRQ